MSLPAGCDGVALLAVAILGLRDDRDVNLAKGQEVDGELLDFGSSGGDAEAVSDLTLDLVLLG